MKPRLLIRASAGTGKTYQLTNRYLALLGSGVHPSAILATTFTRKAAAEIRERIFLRLAHATEVPSTLPWSCTNSEAEQMLRALILTQERMLICTMDSLCVQIAKMFSLELGLAEDWSIADQLSQADLLEISLNEALATGEQALIEHTIRTILGNEATRSVSARLRRHLNQLLNLLRLSTDPAWQIPVSILPTAPRVNVADLTDKLKALPLPTTLKGLPEKNWLNARARTLTNLSEAAWLSILDDNWVTKVANGEPFSRKVAESELTDVLVNLQSWALHHCMQELNSKTEALATFSQLLHQQYLKELVKTQSFAFQDIKHLIRILFAAEEDLSEILNDIFFRLDSKIQHVLLDEFQDTSLEEWKVLEPIVDELLGQGEERTFFCVGDIKQAIYGWRGGQAELLDQLCDRWPQINSETMVDCRRCSEAVIAFVNQLFQSLPDMPISENYHKGCQAWVAKFSEHTALNNRTGYTEVIAIDCEEDQQVNNSRCLEEAVRLCQRLCLESSKLSVAILTRTNQAAKECADLLRVRCPQLPCSLEGGALLIDSSAVRVVLAALMIHHQPQEKIYSFIVSSSPLGELLGLTDWRNSNQLNKVNQLLSKKLANEGIIDTLAYLIRLIVPLCSRTDRRACHLLLQLANNASEKTIPKIMTIAEGTRVKNSETARVSIMTIHSSKGLEFDAVILPDLNHDMVKSPTPPFVHSLVDNPWEGITAVVKAAPKALAEKSAWLQDIVDKADNARLYESLSLLYVALTRAKIALYAIIPAQPKSNSFAECLASTNAITKPDDSLAWLKELDNNITEQALSRQLPAIQADCLQFRGNTRNVMMASRSTSTLSSEQASDTLKRDHGILVHAALSQISWLTSIADLPDILKPLGSQLLLLLSRDRYSLAPNESLTVHNELPFSFINEEETILTGRWDRVVLKERAGQIIYAEAFEFKTGQTNTPEIQRQLAIYSEALQRLVGKGNQFELNIVPIKLDCS